MSIELFQVVLLVKDCGHFGVSLLTETGRGTRVSPKTTHPSTDSHTHTQRQICARTHAHTQTHTHTQRHEHDCMHMHMCKHTCTCTHTHTHTHLRHQLTGLIHCLHHMSLYVSGRPGKRKKIKKLNEQGKAEISNAQTRAARETLLPLDSQQKVLNFCEGTAV